MNNEVIIKIDKISKIMGKEAILDNVSFSIKSSEFVSIKGPSGCGKTTLLRILSGLTEPTDGKIYLYGNLANSPKILIPPFSRNINLLFQDLALWPHLTGYEQLKFVWESTTYRKLNERIEELCSEIGFPRILLSKYPSQLSRGENQRLAIVRTLISHPKILLLDEPLTALDQKLRKLFIKFLGKLKKENITTVILVSHDLMTDVIDYDQQFIHKNKTFLKV